MQKEIWPGSALLAPVPPALVSCGSVEQPAVLTIGWTGIVNTRPPPHLYLGPARAQLLSYY